MKVEIKVKKEIELKTLVVKASPRYWEDSQIDGVDDTENGDNMPCKTGDLWCPEIDVDSGRVLNWKVGVEAAIHYKVCDECAWELKDNKGKVVLSAEDGYVPDTLSPKEEGYGDYIIMNIDKYGNIQDWDFQISDFEDKEE